MATLEIAECKLFRKIINIEVDFYSAFFISYKLILEIMFYYSTDLNTHKNGSVINLKCDNMGS